MRFGRNWWTTSDVNCINRTNYKEEKHYGVGLVISHGPDQVSSLMRLSSIIPEPPNALLHTFLRTMPAEEYIIRYNISQTCSGILVFKSQVNSSKKAIHRDRFCKWLLLGVNMRIDVHDLIERIEDWWPWHWGDDEEKENPDLNPVLLVPGIGGSILNAVNEKGHKERIWVRLFAADHEFRTKLFSLYNPLTGKTDSLDPNTTVEVPDDRYGLYSCDILDPAVILRMDVVYYFHDLIKQLTDWGYKEGTTLFGFGYDFRQSNRLLEHMEKLKEKLKSMYEASGGKKANIISHSMGGVLVKSFLALHHDFFEQYVDTWIAVSVPFQGAPGFIMDCLLTGVEFVKGWQRELFVAKWSMHQLLIECPSVYELLASSDFPWADPPELRLWRQHTDENGEKSTLLERYGPGDYLGVMRAALQGNTMNFNGATIPTPMNTEILKWAEKTKLILQIAELPESVKFYNVVGTSLDTPFHTCYGSKEHPIEQLSDILNTEADFSFVDGDGTVPLESSMADGMKAEMRIGIPGDHRGILNDERLFRILKHWLKVGDPDPDYDPLWDFVLIPRWKFEWERYDKNTLMNVPEVENTWELISCDQKISDQASKAEEVAAATATGVTSQTTSWEHIQVNSRPEHSSDQVCRSGIKIPTNGVVKDSVRKETLTANEVRVEAFKRNQIANTRNREFLRRSWYWR